MAKKRITKKPTTDKPAKPAKPAKPKKKASRSKDSARVTTRGTTSATTSSKPAASKSRSRSTRKADASSNDLPTASNTVSPTSATLPTMRLPPPAWLKVKPVACEKWWQLVDELTARRLLISIDIDLLALYCDAWQEFAESAEEMEREGRFFTTDKGYVAVHPAKLQRDKAVETIQRLADRLGIGVNKRRGLVIINTDDEDDSDGDPIAAYAKLKPKRTERE